MCQDYYLISLVTVVYNGVKTIERLLRGTEQLITQYPVVQHVIVDGGSKDGTRDILSEYSRRNRGVCLVFEPDEGIFDAMNKGVAIASGEYVLHVNADDEIMNPDSWKKISSVLRTRKPKLLSTPVELFDEKKDAVVRILPHKPLSHLHKKFGFHFAHQGTFISRAYLTSVGAYNKEIGYVADKIMFFQALDSLPDVEMICSPTRVCRQYTGGVSSASMYTPLVTIKLTLNARHIAPFKAPFRRAILNPIFKLAMRNAYKKSLASTESSISHVGDF